MKPKLKETRWSHELEKNIRNLWENAGIYKFNSSSKNPVFSIDTPPPYVNSPVHIGHAYTYTIMDAIARFRRMTGFNVLFPMGLDKNGLPIEVQTEKKFDISIRNTPREEFIRKCKQLIEQAGDASLDSFKRLGLSCNSWETEYKLGGKYDTDDPEYRRLTQEIFIDFWKRGLIYEDDKPTNYCPVCRTAISDAEVEYAEKETKLNFIKFNVKETNEDIIVATTRPELLCTCKILLYNPEDKRYSHLKNKTAIVPIFKHEVKIIPHPYAKMEYGSGLVMICSFGDFEDLRILRELKIQPTYAIDGNGRMNSNAGSYQGLSVKDARAKIIEDLRNHGRLMRQDNLPHREPQCWRSKNPVEFIAMKEFYLHQVKFKEELLKLADNMKFFASESRQFLVDWINSLSIDWVISRRRYYGTEIPLWYCKKCNFAVVPKPGKYYQPWKEKSPIEVCPKCKGREFVGEARVFDTWFDSSHSNAYVLGYLWDKKFFKKNYPCSLRPQGREIVRTWLYFTLLESFLLLKKKPFENCWIHMYVVDEKGEKMSKSLGNVIDPQYVLDRYGAEAFRLWVFLEGDITKGDIRCSFQRIEGTSKFLTKLWNIARFISMFPQSKDVKLTPTDKWIVSELNKLVEDCRKSYENFNFFMAANKIRDFVWNVFADHYIEMIKARAYGEGFNKLEQKSAQFTLHLVLNTALKLLSPIVPFITDYTWRELYGKKSIHIEEFPKISGDNKLIKFTKKILEFNSKVWNEKKYLKVSLKDEIKMEIPKELKPFEKDLRAMHNIKI